MIGEGLGYVNQVYEAYNTIKQTLNILNYASAIVKMIGALAQPTPAAAAAAIATVIEQQFGVDDVSDLLSGFNALFKAIGPKWQSIGNAVLQNAEKIAAEAAPQVLLRLPAYTAAQEQGRLKFVFFAPTGPGFRSNDTYINTGGESQIAIAATGGRLFGFGIRTSKQNVDQIFRIDYWDVRTDSLGLHYHVYSDGHAPYRSI